MQNNKLEKIAIAIMVIGWFILMLSYAMQADRVNEKTKYAYFYFVNDSSYHWKKPFEQTGNFSLMVINDSGYFHGIEYRNNDSVIITGDTMRLIKFWAKSALEEMNRSFKQYDIGVVFIDGKDTVHLHYGDTIKIPTYDTKINYAKYGKNSTHLGRADTLETLQLNKTYYNYGLDIKWAEDEKCNRCN